MLRNCYAAPQYTHGDRPARNLTNDGRATHQSLAAVTTATHCRLNRWNTVPTYGHTLLVIKKTFKSSKPHECLKTVTKPRLENVTLAGGDDSYNIDQQTRDKIAQSCANAKPSSTRSPNFATPRRCKAQSLLRVICLSAISSKPCTNKASRRALLT